MTAPGETLNLRQVLARLAVVALCCAGCATVPAARPALAEPEVEVPAAESSLTEAWAEPAAVRADVPGASVADAPTPVDRRGPFKDARQQAQAALRKHRLDEARDGARRAVEAASLLHGQERDQAGQLAFSVELEAADQPRAQAAALAWRRSCGPEELEGCRARALAGLARVKSAAPLVTRLREAESCLAQGERALPCLPKVEATAAAAQDELLVGRAQWARAQAEKNEARKVAALEKVERCGAVGCAGVRHRAFQVQASLASAAKDLPGVARALIRDGQVAASAVDPELRTWVRAKELDEACARLDASAGAGSCRRLEKELTGSWTFRDFSKDKGGGSGLSADQVKLVNQHYAPLLEECLTEQARRLTPPDAQEFEVRWVVSNDGHVRDAHLRKDLDAMPFAECLRKQFSLWRYPRFEGELQHVQQRFTVTASTRTSMR